MKDIPQRLQILADYSGIVHAINSFSAVHTAILSCMIKLTEHNPDSTEYIQEVEKALEALGKSNEAVKTINDRLAQKLKSVPTVMSIEAILRARGE